jgi:hypothetical protein
MAKQEKTQHELIDAREARNTARWIQKKIAGMAWEEACT